MSMTFGKSSSVSEQNSIQRLSPFMKEFFKLQRDPEVDNAAYGANVEVILGHEYRAASTRAADTD